MTKINFVQKKIILIMILSQIVKRSKINNILKCYNLKNLVSFNLSTNYLMTLWKNRTLMRTT